MAAGKPKTIAQAVNRWGLGATANGLERSCAPLPYRATKWHFLRKWVGHRAPIHLRSQDWVWRVT